MSIKLRPRSVLLCAVLAALLLSAGSVADAGASPGWKFNGSLLFGTETISGGASNTSLTIPGLTTKCKSLSYKMTISNSAGTGKGEITALSFSECSTDSKACTVESMTADKLPWQLHATTVSLKNYVIVEGVRISILYGGAECALGETVATVTGTAGGLFDNTNSTITFNALNFTATGTALKVFGSKVEWNCILTTEATGAHSGQALTL
jgi:hypothetical protein